MNRMRFRIEAAAVVMLFGAAIAVAPVHAGPDGAVNVHGSASIAQFGNFYFITTSHGDVIQYTSFNVDLNETVQFIQPSANSAVLNVIPGGGATTINGKIFADGIVFFANPSGFVFGPQSTVNAAGFYAAAASVSGAQMQNFHDGNDFSVHVPAGGAVITIADGASISGASGVGLIGRQIINHGHVSVSDPGATVYMAALSNGDVVISSGSYLVSMPALNGVGDPFAGPGVTISSTGQVQAPGAGSSIQLGASDMYGLAIRMEGSGVSGSNVDFHGSVELASNVSVAATESMTFHSTVNSSGDGVTTSDEHTLTGNAAGAAVVFEEAVGGNADGALGEIAVTGQTIAVTDVTTTGDQTYNAPGGVTLGSTYIGDNFTVNGNTTLVDHVAVEMAGGVNFLGTIDGAGMDLSVLAGDTAFFLNNIGSGGALGDVDISVGTELNNAALADVGSVIQFGDGSGLFTFNANSIALNDFRDGFNDPLYIGHTEFATIAAPNALTFNTNQFNMGQGQKMTVIGNLNLNVGGGGTAVISDLNTFGNMNVNSPGGIQILTRPAGGSDLGTDFVATGAFNFTGPISTLGGGSPPLFANPTGNGPAGQTTLVYSPAFPADFIAMSGQLLDLNASLGTPPDDPSGENPGPGGGGPGNDPEAPPELDPGIIDDLEDIVDLRDLTDEERRALTEGRGLFVDGQPSEVIPEGAAPRNRVASRRLNAREVRLFKQQEERLYDRFDEYAESLEDAWTTYSDEFGEAITPDGFATFLTERETLHEALEGLRNIAEYVRAMESMGMTPKEARDEAFETVYEDFLPAGMTKEQFEEAVRTIRARQIALR